MKVTPKFSPRWKYVKAELENFLERHKIPAAEWAEFLFDRYKKMLRDRQMPLFPAMAYSPKTVAAYNAWLAESTAKGYQTVKRRPPPMLDVANRVVARLATRPPAMRAKSAVPAIDKGLLAVALCEFAHSLDSRVPDHLLLDPEHWRLADALNVLEAVL